MATIDKKIGCKQAGRGGLKCVCCGPALRHRKAFMRQVKRGKVKEFVRKDIEDQDPHRRILVNGQYVVDAINDPVSDQED